MLTDPKLRSQVDALWDKFWTGGLANPLDAIEQFSYLLFLKQLEDRENAAERQTNGAGQSNSPAFHWRCAGAKEYLAIVMQVEALRRRQAEARRQGEELFQGLLSEAFGD